MTMTMMMDGNEHNAGVPLFLASSTQTGGAINNSLLEKKGQQMRWQWDLGHAMVVYNNNNNKSGFMHKQEEEEEEETTEQWINKVWMNLAQQVAHGNFHEHMTKLDAMVWIRHGIKVLERIIMNSNNNKETSKDLILENATLLRSFAWLMRHPVPVSVMLDDDLRYFERLGKIFQTGATIAPEAFRQIGVALVDALVKCATTEVTTQQRKQPKKVFQKLESTGWLKLFLVWAADKTITISKDKAKTLDLLKNNHCTSFVMTSFQVGTPCGEQVRKIVKCEESCPVALACYVDLIQISESTECAYKYCDTMDCWDKMFHCGKCKKVYYCCRECQIAAWNEHKPTCCLEFVHHAMHQPSSNGSGY